MKNDLVKLVILIDPQTGKDISSLIMEKGWDRDDGLRMLIGAGLAAARLHPIEYDSDQALPDDARTRWLKVEANLAVTRYRLFEAEQANRSWELSTGAIRRQNVGLENILRQKNEEIEHLKKSLESK